MTRAEIEQQAEQFFEWPSDNRSTVTYTSALLFAEHCVKQVVQSRIRQGQIDLLGGK